MRDYISLGEVPCNENCCQVGRDNYDKYGKLEAYEYKRMIEDTLGPFSEVKIKVTKNPHDFGWYYDVIVDFYREEEAIKLACEIEDNVPQNWDESHGPGFGFLTWNDAVSADEYRRCSS